MERIKLKKIKKEFKIGSRIGEGTLARVLNILFDKENKNKLEVLTNIDLTVNSGEILGIIGENGCGKSTLLRILAGIYCPNSGNMTINGKIISLINLVGGLKERLTMKENIFIMGSFLGLGQEEIRKKLNSIINFSELDKFIDTKIYQFSQGMLQRLVFSIAIHANPEILILDEVFEVGDEEFRIKSGNKLRELAKNGAAIIIVSHNLELIQKECTKIIVMNKGKIIYEGNPKKGVNEYLKLFY